MYVHFKTRQFLSVSWHVYLYALLRLVLIVVSNKYKLLSSHVD